MAGVIYTDAISVIKSDTINIPEPGIIYCNVCNIFQNKTKNQLNSKYQHPKIGFAIVGNTCSLVSKMGWILSAQYFETFYA